MPLLSQRILHNEGPRSRRNRRGTSLLTTYPIPTLGASLSFPNRTRGSLLSLAHHTICRLDSSCCAFRLQIPGVGEEVAGEKESASRKCSFPINRHSQKVTVHYCSLRDKSLQQDMVRNKCQDEFAAKIC